MSEANVFSFKVPKRMADLKEESAIPQVDYRTNPLHQEGLIPKRVDPTTPVDRMNYNQYGQNGLKK